jgi:hypothetical protein
MPIVAILWQQGAFLRFPAEVPVMTLTPLPLGCIAATLLPQPLDPGFVTEMHIDTDEANAAGIALRTTGELVLNDEDHEASVVTHHKAAG